VAAAVHHERDRATERRAKILNSYRNLRRSRARVPAGSKGYSLLPLYEGGTARRCPRRHRSLVPGVNKKNLLRPAIFAPRLDGGRDAWGMNYLGCAAAGGTGSQARQIRLRTGRWREIQSLAADHGRYL